MLPEGCTILDNDWGTAPGCAFFADGVHVIMLPGPPSECLPMFHHRAVPYLQALSEGVIASHTLKLFGIGESAMEAQLRDEMTPCPTPPWPPTPRRGSVELRVTAKAATDEEVVSVLAAAHAEPEAMALGGCAVPGCYKVASGVPLLDGRVRRMINQGLLLVSDATSQAVADLVVGDTAPESFLEIGAGRATKTILDQSIAYRRYGKQIPEYVTVDVHAFKTKLLQERAEQYGRT